MGMRVKEHQKKFIIYVLMLCIFTIGIKARLDAMQQVFFLCDKSEYKIENTLSIIPSEDINVEQISKRQLRICTFNYLRLTRNSLANRYGIFFVIFTLSLLEILAKLNWGVLAIHGDRCIYRERYIITYIQNKDGEKISICMGKN